MRNFSVLVSTDPIKPIFFRHHASGATLQELSIKDAQELIEELTEVVREFKEGRIHG